MVKEVVIMNKGQTKVNAELPQTKGKFPDRQAIAALKRNVDTLAIPEPTKGRLLVELVHRLCQRRGRHMKKAESRELALKASDN
jgi:hypothetical protein